MKICLLYTSVTRDSVKNLITSGLEDDYSSYVDEAEKSYFVIKNKELFLKLYKLVNTFEDDFNGIFTKRDNIEEILDERKSLREDLSITDIDELTSFEKKVLEQISVTDKEKEVLDNISNYTSRIEFKESRLDELEHDNNSVEILAILREFNLIDTYDSDEYGNDEESKEDTSDEIKEETKEEELQEEEPIVKEVIDPYRIKEMCIRDRAISTLLFCPPDNCEMVCLSISYKSNNFDNSLYLFTKSFPVIP